LATNLIHLINSLVSSTVIFLTERQSTDDSKKAIPYAAFWKL